MYVDWSLTCAVPEWLLWLYLGECFSQFRAENNASLSSGGSCEEHPLLAPCLNGLGKFSHLIDLDFMGDLMGCLKKLSGYKNHYDGFSLQNSLSVSERLQCCIVAFRVMRSNLDALNVDLHDFFVQLYNLLLEYRPDRYTPKFWFTGITWLYVSKDGFLQSMLFWIVVILGIILALFFGYLGIWHCYFLWGFLSIFFTHLMKSCFLY